MQKTYENFKDQEVCIIGLGYVGLTLASAMAESGFQVTGVEIRQDVLKLLNSGKPHFFEPGLDGRIKKFCKDGRMKFYAKLPKDCKATVFIITVGTPLGLDGKSNMNSIQAVTEEVAKILKPDDLVILRSTVKIGTTRKVVLPLLKKCNIKFDLAFCPERTLEGKALVELTHLPQIVGGLSLSSSIRASQIFQFITPRVIRVSDLETAELIKLIDNTNRDIMFAYSNEVARACDALGISAIEVIEAGKLGYPRTNLPMPGLVGGPCLEKDPHILAEGLIEKGLTPEITLAARRINERQPVEIVSYIASILKSLPSFPSVPVITLLGLAFKGQPATDDLRGSMSISVLKALRENFPEAEFRGYDAIVKKNEIAKLGIEPYSKIDDSLINANLVLILNNHIQFIDMPIEILSSKLAKSGLIYDFWNLFDASKLSLAESVGYIALGSHGRGILPKGLVRG